MTRTAYRVAAFFLLIAIIIGITANFTHAAEFTAEVAAKSAVLMEASTGRILFAYNENEALPPASVTKIMTLLLVMEAVDNGTIKMTDMVQASEHAASMGGSQIYLKVGEEMSVEELIKSVVVSSANDAAVALAEYVAGSEEAFVALMNKRAGELGMVNTSFENTNGLDDDTKNHLTSALDIAIMSRELLKHETILNYTGIWMDTIRDGAFGLTNTNRLIKFYSGANGLKTGSTSKAGFCISATALRDGLQLIAVIMGSPTRDIRNEEAKKLLDFGFANYSHTEIEGSTLTPLPVYGGYDTECPIVYESFEAVVEKGKTEKIETVIDLPESLAAPIQKGDVVGKITYMLDGEALGSVDITASVDVPKITYYELLIRIIKEFLVIG